MSLKFFAWNVQGCGNPRFLLAARHFLRENKPDHVGILEQRVSGLRADSIIAALGFHRSHRVKAIGNSGGIWLCWNSSVEITILYSHFQFIHCQVSFPNSSFFLASIVYGTPKAAKRRSLWSGLRYITRNITSSWIILGDFNATLSSSDRMGCASLKHNKDFQDFLWDLSLRDKGFHGPNYTWSRSTAQVRLDCCLCNSYWDECFPKSSILHLLRMRSDHRPIFLQVEGTEKNLSKAHLRNFSGWLSHDDFTRMVCDNWTPGPSLSEIIRSFTMAADVWNTTLVTSELRNIS
ncbi:uncharacterized protein LOC120168854 [Hibiscus syriacus]|uniref:uncharacterized protein LOC120168854 n=1 Tax=Hibiscus syriacus TaxID=106335 RepID=UPI001923BA11|nr:uncharacterized protein LOC120168854 [Hibiscus syriacus]